MTAEFRYHPAAQRPMTASLTAMALGMVAGGAWAVLPEPAVVLPLLALLVASVLPFFAPTVYRLDEEVLEIQRAGTCRRLPWSRFRTVRADRNGLLLEGRRDHFLPMDADLRREVLPLVEERLR